MKGKTDMRISRLLMPAVTLAGALALAGCGGGSDTPAGGGGEGNEGDLTAEELGAICGDLGFDLEAQKCNEPNVDSASIEKALRDAQKYSALIGNPTAPTTIADLSSGDRPAIPEAASDKKVADYKGKKTKISAQFEADQKYIVINTAAEFGMSSSGDFHTDSAAKDHEPSGAGTEVRLAGAFSGASGHFVCNTASDAMCQSGINPAGAVMLTGVWHFYPADENAMVDGPKLAEWGWWINEQPTPDVARVFYGRVNGVTTALPVSATLTSVGGTAKYQGAAHGLYAITKTGESDSGSFDATVNLDAAFGTSPTIEGTVSGFEATGKDLAGWEITLHKSTLTASGILDTSGSLDNDGEAVWKSGTTTVAEGNWEVQAYGAASSHPSHVLGAFGAGEAEGDAKIIGAFGTDKQ